MNRPIQIRTHPLPFLLLLEWLLLLTVAITEALSIHFRRFHTLPSLTIISLVGFGLLGLRMPTGKLLHKTLYTALEICLILLAGIVSSRGIRLFPFLYIILVIRSCLIFQLPGRIIVTSLSFALFVLTLIHRFQHVPAVPMLQERLRFTLLSFALSFGLSLVFVLLLMNAVLAERQIREKLAIANDQLRQYALRIEDQATLQERNRIARDIHDSLGHSLTALNLQLETALKLWQSNPAKAQTFLAQAKNLGSQALQEVRQSVSAMRSDPLHGQSLEVAIAALVTEFHHSTGFSPIYHLVLKHSIPAEVKTAVYRIAQEALTNIWKHAQANEVKINIQTSLESLHLKIADNGKGFVLNKNTTGFGLQSMRDRVLALGGEFQISSALGAGCCITATIPLPRLLT
ncbi:sensor histidine kinase [Gloeocapsopsis dulcis]|uniref:histidine kinase n=1 Tax=Gloeocapsopsis dulcis AAB1 = 1H9 TaxID=1433147 RepID=A0A6N8FQC8_9CHRO|nr:sensor histidine kinase [Gloeocapsopsis dulcis]MUL35438.1 two-component sensor histidine kinase [Gloeocapsopsis dulcis AAB1 = 1H9]WNN90364.1 sensor histidine kinase [Gloeocapsopsis dulcis]